MCVFLEFGNAQLCPKINDLKVIPFNQSKVSLSTTVCCDRSN